MRYQTPAQALEFIGRQANPDYDRKGDSITIKQTSLRILGALDFLRKVRPLVVVIFRDKNGHTCAQVFNVSKVGAGVVGKREEALAA